MLKVDLHLHSSEDPRDALDYSARELILHAVYHEFDAIALTLHGVVLQDPSLTEFASKRGILLIPGIEKRIQGKEVLVYNVTQREMDDVHSFADLRALKKRRGEDILIMAPHPFFRRAQCLGRELERNLDVFDAIEYCHLYTRFWNLNRRAMQLAAAHGKALVATSDAHALWMFGRNFTWVDAPRTVPGIFDAIRRRRIRAQSEPISALDLARKLSWFILCHNLRKALRDSAGRNGSAPARPAANPAASSHLNPRAA